MGTMTREEVYELKKILPTKIKEREDKEYQKEEAMKIKSYEKAITYIEDSIRANTYQGRKFPWKFTVEFFCFWQWDRRKYRLDFNAHFEKLGFKNPHFTELSNDGNLRFIIDGIN